MKVITIEEIKNLITNERGKGIDWIIAFLLSISKIAKDEQTITETKGILNEILEPLFFHSPISKIELQFKLCDKLKKESHKDIHSTACSFFFLPNPQTVTQQVTLSISHPRNLSTSSQVSSLSPSVSNVEKLSRGWDSSFELSTKVLRQPRSRSQLGCSTNSVVWLLTFPFLDN